MPLGLPIDKPSKVICVGLNYRDHAEELGAAVPREPVLFAKWPSALIGPGEEIRIPAGVQDVDYEAELGVVIGRRAQRVSEADALDYIGGYVCANDVTARAIQDTDGQWTRSKSIDTFGPVGPRLTSADVVSDPQDLAIRCWHNGQLVQNSHTSKMLFSVAEVIAFITRTTTLEPGDLLFTGTPAGVGASHDPPRALRDGDVVRVAIEQLGEIANPVVAMGAPT